MFPENRMLMVKKIIVGLIMLGMSFVSQGAVAPIASWSFPTLGTDFTPSKTASGVSATMAYAGTATSASGTTTAFPSWEGTAAPTFATVGGQNTTPFVIHLTGSVLTGLSGRTITYAAQTSKSQQTSDTWSWSTDGTTWTTLATQPAGLTTSFASYTADFRGVTGLNNQSSVWFEVIGGSTGNGGTSFTFDNLQVSAVPEPVNVALGLFGLGFAGVAVGRRFYVRLQP
jgi:hypothetical protein